jgi:hypothetical protein
VQNRAVSDAPPRPAPRANGVVRDDGAEKSRRFARSRRKTMRRKRALTTTKRSIEPSALAAAVNREANSPG